jgi:hypothetical protein
MKIEMTNEKFLMEQNIWDRDVVIKQHLDSRNYEELGGFII